MAQLMSAHVASGSRVQLQFCACKRRQVLVTNECLHGSPPGIYSWGPHAVALPAEKTLEPLPCVRQAGRGAQSRGQG